MKILKIGFLRMFTFVFVLSFFQSCSTYIITKNCKPVEADNIDNLYVCEELDRF